MISGRRDVEVEAEVSWVMGSIRDCGSFSGDNGENGLMFGFGGRGLGDVREDDDGDVERE